MNIKTRRFTKGDEYKISELIIKDIYHENIKDEPRESIDKLAKRMTPEFILKRAEAFHGYVLTDNDIIIGVGMIGPYWGSLTESSFFTIFIDPNYLGKGIGRKIIETLEQDEYYKRAGRIEIPASMTALNFYRHFGYGFKRTDKVLGNIVDDEQEYRLEKFPKKSYYNNTDIYNIRPYINNEYHDFNKVIYDLKGFKNNIELNDYINNNENNLYIIEYSGKTIGFIDIENKNDIYIIKEYEDFKNQIIKDINKIRK